MSKTIEVIIVGIWFVFLYLDIMARFGLWYAGAFAVAFIPVFIFALWLSVLIEGWLVA